MKIDKPDINEVLRLIKLKKQVKDIYEEIDGIVEDWVNKYCVRDSELTARYDYALGEHEIAFLEGDTLKFAEELVADGKHYLKLVLFDNLAKFAEDGKLFTTTSVKMFDYETRMLKNRPASLKGGE